MLVLFGLTSLAIVAAIAVSTRLGFESRSERALAVCVLTLIAIVSAIQLLGWLQLLHPGALGGVSLLISMGMLAGGIAGRGWQARLRQMPRAVLDFVRLPFDAVRETWEGRSVAVVGVIATMVVLAWTFFLAWLAPSGAWDGLWYHEPLAYQALQDHGFAIHPLPPDVAPAAAHRLFLDQYSPRTSQDLLLWMVAFSDKRLVDGAGPLIMPTALLALYVMARRVEIRRTMAMGLAAVLFFVPAVVLQMRSSYIDTFVLAGYLASLAFLTRPRFGVREIVMLGLALAFLGGTKLTGLPFAGVIGLAGLGRVAHEAVRARSARPVLHLALGLLPIVLLVVPWYARNWIVNDNPIWPMHYEIDSLGIVLDGPWKHLQDQQQSWEKNAAELWGEPDPGRDYHDTQRHAYGYPLSFVGLPLIVIGLIGSIGVYLRDPRAERAKTVPWLWLMLVLGLVPVVISPSFQWARFALPTPAVLLIVTGWALELRRLRGGIAEGALGAMIVLSLITLYWAEPAWDVSVKRAGELLAQSRAERVTAQTSFCLWSAPMTQAREEKIGPGDVVAYTGRVDFMANLWNEDVSNRVVWVRFRDPEQYLADLRRRNAEWAVVMRSTPEERALGRPGSGWRLLGTARTSEVVYERAPTAERRSVPARAPAAAE